MADELNIYQKLAKIRKPVEVLQKNKAGYGYKYVTEDVILSKITGLMDKLGVSLVPNIKGGTTVVTPYNYTKTKSTKDGKIYEEQVNEILVHCDMEWQWINNDKPESDASQAFGSGLSYASRYFMLKYFNVATSDDDPDNWRTAQKEAENAENKEIAAQIIEQVHNIVVAYLEEHPDDKATVASVVKKYAREGKKASANYYAIDDPVVAGNLLQEVTEKFTNKKEK